jgi:uncharacterized PurR-regulated membrane protein YhhQ (DUF165 family)
MWLSAYVASVVGVNIAFDILPLIETPWGVVPPAAVFVGAVFVLRDFAQRVVGHWVLFGMAVGVALSYWLASPYVALASAAAFAVSELVDWAVYTLLRRPFRERVLASSLLGAPVDSAVFLLGIGAFSWFGVVVMALAKLAVAVAVYLLRPGDGGVVREALGEK